jgi:NAD(P)-dependent dehydrogenase (short-subunit alcohol dehydrogenase family)
MFTVRAFGPNLNEDGAIVTLGSVAGMRAMIGADGYTASKGAVVALTRSWAVEYSRHGIRVNCVCPGPTDTGMMTRAFADVDETHRLEMPQQRMATPEEVAAVIAFLAGPQASFVSGAVVPVDGAATANTAGMPFPRRRARH